MNVSCPFLSRCTFPRNIKIAIFVPLYSIVLHQRCFEFTGCINGSSMYCSNSFFFFLIKYFQDVEVPLHLLRYVCLFCGKHGLSLMKDCFEYGTPETLPFLIAHAFITVVSNVSICFKSLNVTKSKRTQVWKNSVGPTSERNVYKTFLVRNASLLFHRVFYHPNPVHLLSIQVVSQVFTQVGRL